MLKGISITGRAPAELLTAVKEPVEVTLPLPDLFCCLAVMEPVTDLSKLDSWEAPQICARQPDHEGAAEVPLVRVMVSVAVVGGVQIACGGRRLQAR